jgi:hypothetical protein
MATTCHVRAPLVSYYLLPASMPCLTPQASRACFDEGGQTLLLRQAAVALHPTPKV